VTNLFQELFTDSESKMMKQEFISNFAEQTKELEVECCFEMDDSWLIVPQWLTSHRTMVTLGV